MKKGKRQEDDSAFIRIILLFLVAMIVVYYIYDLIYAHCYDNAMNEINHY